MRFTKKDKLAFQYWLLENGLTIRKFAQNCGVSHQYISDVICGKINTTEKIIETFKRNGYQIVLEKED